MRIRGAEAELEQAGLDTEGMIQSTSKLRALVEGMTGFDIMKDENTFKDIYEIVVGIGEKWSELSDVNQAALLEALAGKRQGNALSAALNNIDMIKKAYQTAEDSEGSAMKEQETYLGSLEAKTAQFEATFQSMATTILDSDLLKFFIDFGTGAVSVLEKVTDKFGLLSTIGMGTGLYKGIKNVGRVKLIAYPQF